MHLWLLSYLTEDVCPTLLWQNALHHIIYEWQKCTAQESEVVDARSRLAGTVWWGLCPSIPLTRCPSVLHPSILALQRGPSHCCSGGRERGHCWILSSCLQKSTRSRLTPAGLYKGLRQEAESVLKAPLILLHCVSDFNQKVERLKIVRPWHCCIAFVVWREGRYLLTVIP